MAVVDSMLPQIDLIPLKFLFKNVLLLMYLLAIGSKRSYALMVHAE